MQGRCLWASLMLFVLMSACAFVPPEQPPIPTPTPTLQYLTASDIVATRSASQPSLRLRNPTFDEMIAFLNKNTVNWNAYTPEYVCLDFACDLQKAAAAQGIRMAVVLIEFPKLVFGHALVAFETTDQGLIYFEPQVDHRMKVEIGRKYWSWIYWPEYDYDMGYDDTVVSIQLFWDLPNSQCR